MQHNLYYVVLYLVDIIDYFICKCNKFPSILLLA